jgi:hypothetical protein
MNKFKILIVLKNIFIIWYANFLFALINSTCVIFWYEQFNGGLEWPKNNVGKLYSLKYVSWNNPRGRKPSIGAIVNDLLLLSTIYSTSKKRIYFLTWMKFIKNIPSWSQNLVHHSCSPLTLTRSWNNIPPIRNNALGGFEGATTKHDNSTNSFIHCNMLEGGFILKFSTCFKINKHNKNKCKYQVF